MTIYNDIAERNISCTLALNSPHHRIIALKKKINGFDRLQAIYIWTDEEPDGERSSRIT